MKNKLLFGAIVGLAVGSAVAGAFAVKKVAKEMKSETEEYSFESPSKDRLVTLSCGTSQTAKGLTRIQITASVASREDACKLLAFAKKSDGMVEGEWIDNDHFKLWIGAKKRQCCDVSFVDDHIAAHYYLSKKA